MTNAPIPLDRYRATKAATQPDLQPEPHECSSGWLDRDAARPCLTCRPYLAPDALRARLAAETTPPGVPVDWSGRLGRRRQQRQAGHHRRRQQR